MSKEEFAILAEKYMDTIYRVAYSWTKNPDDANDVTQDVLIQLYKTTREFESACSASFLLYRCLTGGLELRKFPVSWWEQQPLHVDKEQESLYQNMMSEIYNLWSTIFLKTKYYEMTG